MPYLSQPAWAQLPVSPVLQATTYPSHARSALGVLLTCCSLGPRESCTGDWLQSWKEKCPWPLSVQGSPPKWLRL